MYQSAIICVPSGLIDGRTMLITLIQVAHRLAVGARETVVDELRRGLRGGHFRRVQGEALDGHGFAVGDQLPDVGLGKPPRIREARVDLAVLVEPGEVGRRRNEERNERPALARLAELDQLHAIGRLRERLVVLVQLVPIGELAIGAHLEAEEFFRRGQRGRRLRLAGDRRRRRARARTSASSTTGERDRSLAFMARSYATRLRRPALTRRHSPSHCCRVRWRRTTPSCVAAGCRTA